MNRERKHIRLRNYDYSSEGVYFITICVKDRICSFGDIVNQEMKNSDIGVIAERYIQDISKHYSQVEMIEYVIMPNHVHLLMYLDPKRTRHVVSLQNVDQQGVSDANNMADSDDKNEYNRTSHVMSLPDNDIIPERTRHVVSQHVVSQHVMAQQERQNQFSKPISGSVSVIIQQYKASVKRWCNKNNNDDFKWQFRFHDHIVRNDTSFNKISNYIINNPANWDIDSLNKE